MNALVTQQFNPQLPAFLQKAELFTSKELTGGITGGQPPTISIKGSKWALLEQNGETLYVNQLQLDVVVVGGNRHVSKTFYNRPYDPNDSGPPECWSDNGQAPSSQAMSPQSASCAMCPNAAFGSKVNEATGAGMKACGDSKKLAVVLAAPTNCLVNGAAQVVEPFQQVYLLRLPAMSMRPWKEFAEDIERRGVPVKAGIVTRLGFDPQASYPKVTFAALAMVTEEQYRQFEAHVDSEAAKNVAGANDSPLAAGAAPVAAQPGLASTPSPTATHAGAGASPTIPPASTPAAAAPAQRRPGRPRAAQPAAVPTASPIPAALPASPLLPATPANAGVTPAANGVIAQPVMATPDLDAQLAALFKQG